eukprot:UN07803
MYPFDMLYVNGKIFNENIVLLERRALLHQHFTEIEGVLQYAQYVNGSEDSDIDGFLQRAIVDSCEGLNGENHYIQNHHYMYLINVNGIKIKKINMDGAGFAVSDR